MISNLKDLIIHSPSPMYISMILTHMEKHLGHDRNGLLLA
jgi:hypothetical protein